MQNLAVVLEQPPVRREPTARGFGLLVAGDDRVRPAPPNGNRVRRVEAANDSRRPAEHLGDEPHPRHRLLRVEDGVAERVVDGGAPERNRRHHQRPLRPDDLLKRPNSIDGAALEAQKPVERAVHHEHIARDDAEFQQCALEIRRRESAKHLMVGSREPLQPPLGP